MTYRYEYKPALEAPQVGALREAVAWDARVEKYERNLDNTY